MWTSKRPHGKLFSALEVNIYAVVKDDAHMDVLVGQMESLDLDESLAAVARRIEEAMPDVRVEIHV